MEDLAKAYVRFLTDGSEADAWATEELSELARYNPNLAWSEIRRINSIPVSGAEWQQHIYSAVGCGPLEDLLVLHQASMLSIVIEAAEQDEVLRRELSAIYESSVPPSTWAAIQSVIAQRRAGGDVR